MSIEAASTSSTVSSTSQSAQVSSSNGKESTKKSSSDASFKDELAKVSSKENKDENKSENLDTQKKDSDIKNSDQNQNNPNQAQTENSAMAMMGINQSLYDNIQQMQRLDSQVNELQRVEFASGLFDNSSKKSDSLSFSMDKDDALFFINLTNNNDVTSQNVVAQAQSLLNQGADVQEVAKSVKISQTLLNAINTAKETNQPLRIDFDTNVSVILRIGKDNVISANFIPGDKVVEQYLRNNMDTLKATFRENELPYSDLSYSNSSKRENEKRRNKQQGE